MALFYTSSREWGEKCWSGVPLCHSPQTLLPKPPRVSRLSPSSSVACQSPSVCVCVHVCVKLSLVLSSPSSAKRYSLVPQCRHSTECTLPALMYTIFSGLIFGLITVMCQTQWWTSVGKLTATRPIIELRHDLWLIHVSVTLQPICLHGRGGHTWQENLKTSRIHQFSLILPLLCGKSACILIKQNLSLMVS